ncbi:hypothetical protein PanWU01x14_191330 [Parasponia andersonii]|uniref:Retrovirus-related Pol polyprotein from transposon TNT 1-94 n=1 Tax=Parasponia andersonii TaxID=3476 RepID=A0A2P5C204_PARAD|nr:hypothetical protein PanWU01x14_191330 [Parasponia andersonii]
MHKAKEVTTPFGQHFKLSTTQSPITQEEKADMESVPYASGVGSIMYRMVCSRPDLGYAVSVVRRFMSNPGKVHWEALKWILRYLKGSLESVLLFQRQKTDKDAVTGYVDSDYAGNIDQGNH